MISNRCDEPSHPALCVTAVEVAIPQSGQLTSSLPPAIGLLLPIPDRLSACQTITSAFRYTSACARFQLAELKQAHDTKIPQSSAQNKLKRSNTGQNHFWRTPSGQSGDPAGPGLKRRKFAGTVNAGWFAVELIPSHRQVGDRGATTQDEIAVFQMPFGHAPSPPC